MAICPLLRQASCTSHAPQRSPTPVGIVTGRGSAPPAKATPVGVRPDGNLPAPSPGFVHVARAAALPDAARVSLSAAFPKEPRSGL